MFFFLIEKKKSDMAHNDQRSISTVAHNCYGKNQRAQGKTK